MSGKKINISHRTVTVGPHFDVEGVVLQYHNESTRQSPGECALSKLKLSIKVQHAFPDSITVSDYL